MEEKRFIDLNAIENDVCVKLWIENQPRIRKICELKLNSRPDEIDDVISELFLSFCKKTSENGVPEKPKGWLYATLNNIINMKYREIYKLREREKRLSDEEFELSFEVDVIGEKIDEIYDDEIKDKLKELLTEDEYQIIYSVHFDGMKMTEYARQHNTTEAAVRQKHYRICRKLRKLLVNSRAIV